MNLGHYGTFCTKVNSNMDERACILILDSNYKVYMHRILHVIELQANLYYDLENIHDSMSSKQKQR